MPGVCVWGGGGASYRARTQIDAPLLSGCCGGSKYHCGEEGHHPPPSRRGIKKNVVRAGEFTLSVLLSWPPPSPAFCRETSFFVSRVSLSCSLSPSLGRALMRLPAITNLWGHEGLTQAERQPGLSYSAESDPSHHPFGRHDARPVTLTSGTDHRKTFGRCRHSSSVTEFGALTASSSCACPCPCTCPCHALCVVARPEPPWSTQTQNVRV